MRISFDERLDADEHRLLHTDEADDDDDDDEGEREPPVEMMDGAYDGGDSGGDDVEPAAASSSGFGIAFLPCSFCCSKFLRSSDTFGYVNDSVSDGVRADSVETVVSELVVMAEDDCSA